MTPTTFLTDPVTAEAPSLVLLLTTLPSREAAQALARETVQQGLAACAQIEAIDSLYRWDGQICEDQEWRLLLKTTAVQQAALAALVADLHPYELPALLSVPVVWTEPAFAAWVAASCAGKPASR